MGRYAHVSETISISFFNKVENMFPTIDVDFDINWNRDVVDFNYDQSQKIIDICEEVIVRGANVISEWPRDSREFTMFRALLVTAALLQTSVQNAVYDYWGDNDYQNVMCKNDGILPSDFYDNFKFTFA